jgi:putative endonuclease
MFTVYVLKSIKNGKRYVGYTEKSIDVRVKEHNSGCNKWTRRNRSFILVYKEEFDKRISAMRREKFLKSGQGRELLDSILE